MATEKLQKILLWLGIAITILAVVWWAVVNYFLAQQTGGNMFDAVSCIFSFSSSCNFMRGMVWMRGISVYEPLAFWIGVILLATAVSLKRSLAKDAVAG